MKMNIIIPMGGQGKRFQDAGFIIPKPLIKISDVPMYRYAVNSMPLEYAKRLIFILSDNDYFDELSNDINQHYSGHYDCYIVKLLHKTEGQAETVLACAEVLDLKQPTLIHNCDSIVRFPVGWQNLLVGNIDGAIALFDSNENRWSYAKMDSNHERIIDFREKQVISPYASTGTYWFKDTENLLKNIAKIISYNIRENNEYYLSTVYRLMLQEHNIIRPVWTEHFLCFGTPRDLVYSLNYLLKIQKGNVASL